MVIRSCPHQDTAFNASTGLLRSKYTVPFSQLPERVVCSSTYYEEFAHFLANTYKSASGKNAGELLSIRTVLSYLSIMLNDAAKRYKATGCSDSKLFFTCLEGAKTDSGRWLNGLKDKLKREVYLREKSTGTLSDDSQTPVYGVHYKLMVSVLYPRPGA